MTASKAIQCHVCGEVAAPTSRIHKLEAGVTSDCRPWAKEVGIVSCHVCGAVQAPIDACWRQNAEEIYRGYDTYAAAGGEEQRVSSGDSDNMSARSAVLVEWLASRGLAPGSGEVLDVGCGRGAFLAEFTRQFPEWILSGTEFDERNLGVLQKLASFKRLQTARFDKLEGAFDLISMIHVLEHIENPVACLRLLRQRAKPGALLLVQVPDWLANPFALAIADHATHFTPHILERVAREAGWQPMATPHHVVPKELTLLARAGEASSDTPGEDISHLLEKRLGWLREVGRQARACQEKAASFGIFGTAIAGTYLAGACRKRLDFFLDEDANRVGKRHMGVPILSPADVPAGADVFVGMAPEVSCKLAAKYSGGRARFHAVSDFSAL